MDQFESQNALRPATPHGLDIVCYDLETKVEIGATVDGHTVTWDDHHLLGISVGVLFDYRTGDFSVYLTEALPELADRLRSAAMVVGFNQIGFDNKVMRAEFPYFLQAARQYDILLESRKGACVDKYARGFKLDDHLKQMFGESMMKTGHGELAPVDWRAGKQSKVISYCIADVRRTCMVFEHAWAHGVVGCAGSPQHPVMDPWRRYLGME